MDNERKERFERCRVEFMEQVKPTELICHMDDCLTQQLKEQVERWDDRFGPSQAAYRFSMDLVKKDGWYPSLLKALRKLKHDALADKIEGIERRRAVARVDNGESGDDYNGNDRKNGDGNHLTGLMPHSRETSSEMTKPSVYNPHQSRRTNRVVPKYEVRKPVGESNSSQPHSRSNQHILDKRIGSLPSSIQPILERLNVTDVKHTDWRGLANKIDPDNTLDDNQRIERTNNPTQELLNSWKKGNTLQNLLMHLFKLGRQDIIVDLEKELEFNWSRPEPQQEAQEVLGPTTHSEGNEDPTESTASLQREVSGSLMVDMVDTNCNEQNQDNSPIRNSSSYTENESKNHQKQANKATSDKGISKVQKIAQKHEQQRSNEPQHTGENVLYNDSPINDVNRNVASGCSDTHSHVNIPHEAQSRVESDIDNQAGYSTISGSFKSSKCKDNESYPESGSSSCQVSSDMKTSNKAESSEPSVIQSKSVPLAVSQQLKLSDELKGSGRYSTLQSNAEIDPTPDVCRNVSQEHCMVPYKSVVNSMQSADPGGINANYNEHTVKQQDANITPLCSPVEGNKKPASPSPDLTPNVAKDPQHELPEGKSGNDKHDKTDVLKQGTENKTEATQDNLAKCTDYGNKFDLDNKTVASPSPDVMPHVENVPRHELPERKSECGADEAPTLNSSATNDEHDTLNFIKQAIENNKEAVQHNLAKCTENGNNFDFDNDNGASSLRAVNNARNNDDKMSIKISIASENPPDNIPNADQGRGTVLKQEGSQQATVSSDQQVAGASQTDSTVPDEREKANLIPVLSSFVQTVFNVSTHAANTTWQNME